MHFLGDSGLYTPLQRGVYLNSWPVACSIFRRTMFMHSDRRGQLLFTSMQLVTRIIYIWRLTNVKPGHTNSRDGPLPLLRKFYRLFPRFDCIQIIYWPSWNKQTLIYLIFDLFVSKWGRPAIKFQVLVSKTQYIDKYVRTNAKTTQTNTQTRIFLLFLSSN